jgi:alpha-beta hydrolase superfamily lysophospholipase
VGQFRRIWEADEPHAEAVILHGIAEHSGRYEHIGSTLAAAGYRTRAYDHQGFGRSGGPRGHISSWDIYLDDVEDHLDRARESGLPVVLLGHSLGGLIAFTYAVSDRPQPDVLLLTGPALGAETPAWQRIAAPIFGRIAPRLFIKSEFDGGLLSTDADVGAVYEADPLRVKGSTARLGLEAFEAMKYANERLDRLRVPTMVVHGGADRIVPVEFSAPIGAQELATRIVLEGLEHEVLNEPNWAETMQTLIGFADEHVAAANESPEEE